MNEIPVEDIAPSSVQSQPHSRQAEEAVLGSILIDSEAYFNVAQFLKPEDFYIVRNRWIWEAFISLHERRAPIDYLTVCEELSQKGQLAEVGGPAYIMSLINQTPSSLNAEAYGRLVEETSVRRRMLSAANDLARLAYDQKQSVETIMDEAEKSIFSISERRVRNDLQPIQAVLSEVYDRVDQLSRRDDEIFGVPTGLVDLDRLLGGLQKSDLLIFAGRPGMGKTKGRIAIFSMEMSNEQIVQRLVSSETGIGTHVLRQGQLDDRGWNLFVEATGNLSGLRIYLDDTPALSPIQMRTKCRRLYNEYGLDLIMVDYLQLMSSGTGRQENRVQEISFISRHLKQIARELNVPVLAAAQLSRAVEQRQDKRPQLSDLRESGSIEQDADVVMFIYRDEVYNENTDKLNQADIIVAKHRNGPTGTVALFFRKELTQFANMRKDSIDLAGF